MIKKLTSLLFVLLLSSAVQAQKIPDFIKGNFSDDYNISYTINDTLWVQNPKSKYHILKWNNKEQYLIVKNDLGNPSDGGLYTRIDYMTFENMEPYRWGFCLTNYNASTLDAAEATVPADRKNPRKGCGGFPFSRMKKKEDK